MQPELLDVFNSFSLSKAVALHTFLVYNLQG